jgi:hypothetical protein
MRRGNPPPVVDEVGGLNLKLNDIVCYMPHLLDFENKREYFKQELKKSRGD